METTSLDRQPLRAALILLAVAAFYTVVLFQAVGAQGEWRQPGFLQSWLADAQTRLWVWDQFTHTLVVVLLSLPFAWGLTRVYTQRLLPAALMMVAPAVAWMVLDYYSLREQLPDATGLVTRIYFADVAKVALVLPLLVLLLRRRA